MLDLLFPRASGLHSPMRFTWCLVAAIALLSLQVHGQSVKIQPQNAGMRISASGSSSGHYSFEGAIDPAGPWDFLSMLPAPQASQGWVHSKSTTLPYCFYRALWQNDYSPQAAENFRLIDHQGKWRELEYYLNATNTKAFVLIFTGNGCDAVHRYVPTLNSLRN